MTVSSSTNSASYSGNGSTTVFAYGFKIFENSDLAVTLVNDTTGVETTQTLTTHYTVSGAGTNSGGNVTFVTAPASGNTVKIERILPHTQPTAYTENDAFPAQAHEDGLDRLTMLTQQAPSYGAGTFVPTIFDASTGGNQATVSTTYGRYRKIGDIVYLTIGFSGINTSGMNANNTVYVRGLPFTAYDSGTPNLIWAGSVITGDVANPTGGGSFSAAITDNTDYLTIRANVANSPIPENLLVTDIDSGSTSVIYITMFYEAAS